MKILLAHKIDGTWQKVAVVRATSVSYNLPVKVQGTNAGMAARAAINQFRAEGAAVEVNLTLGGRDYRASRL